MAMVALLGIKGDFLEVHHRPPVELDRSDEERRAISRPPEPLRRQRPDAPVAVLGIDDQDLLGALVAPHPKLDDVQPVLDAIADPERHILVAPEIRERVARQPGLDVLVERDLARRRRGGGRGGDVARGPVGLPPILRQRADIGGVRGLDLKSADLGRGQLQGDVVLFGAQDGLAPIRDLDRDPVEGGCPASQRTTKDEDEEGKNTEETHTKRPRQVRTA
jgi:hypothetical protein